jgi:GTP-binding protein
VFDRGEFKVIAGRGGDGVVSFRREKFVPRGGPDGGDGGDGGSVIIRADQDVAGLGGFQGKSVYRAESGGSGHGQKKHGKKGDDLVLFVPVGTVVSNRIQLGESTEVCDLLESGQQVIVARGGRGGLGSSHFASSTNQAPCIAQKGEPGEEKELVLELRLIADVGIIGYPNAGKSSLLSAASAARPKIASYPFTTLEPVLGVVEVDNKTFVMAEIPGLISGAHLGRGLGHDFLRHVIRTRVLIHLVDGSSPSPVGDMTRVNTELSLFDSALALKPQITAVNKIDLAEVKTQVAELKKDFDSIGISPLFISAVTGEGVPALLSKVLEVLGQVADEEVVKGAPTKVFRPRPRGDKISVSWEGDIYMVHSPGLERIIAGTDLTDPEARRQLDRHLRRPEIVRALEKAGARPGDKVRCGIMEWLL